MIPPQREPTRAVGVLFHLENDELLTDVVLRGLLVLWEETLAAFAVDHVLVVDRTRHGLAATFQPTAGHLSWARFASLQEAEAAHPDAAWVYLEQGGEPLAAFAHPRDNVIYAFGPDSTGLPIEPGKHYREIPMPRATGLFALQAATVVLYDRVSRPAADVADPSTPSTVHAAGEPVTERTLA
jgi:tRNA(Leu) C34 or U34 (ribose-2'-O)-methylase TrmL